MPEQYPIVSNIVDENIEHSIGSATRKVTESLGWDKPCKWPMEKINSANYDMSDKTKQIIRLAAKLQKHIEYMTSKEYILL